MPEPTQLLAFALICLGMTLTPGPNMMYLVSRSLSQGYRAGLVSLAGAAPGGQSPFQVRALAPSPPRRLFAMGLFTALLNPKIAVLYLSLLPQFIDPQQGSVLTQSLALGFTQVGISICVNALFTVMAGAIAVFLARRPMWMVAQRWLMGSVLAGLAVRMALDARR
ncbi:LysE family translocator [Bordetella pertussis]